MRFPDGSIVFTVSQRGSDPHIEVLSPEKQRTRLRVPIVGQAQYVANRPPGVQLPRQSDGGQVQSRRARHRRCADGRGEGDSDVRRIRRAGAIGVLGLADRHARVAARRRTGRRQPARARRARRKSLVAFGASGCAADPASVSRRPATRGRRQVGHHDARDSRARRGAARSRHLDDSRRRQPVACVDGQPSPDLRLEPRWASENLRRISGRQKAAGAAFHRGCNCRA